MSAEHLVSRYRAIVLEPDTTALWSSKVRNPGTILQRNLRRANESTKTTQKSNSRPKTSERKSNLRCHLSTPPIDVDDDDDDHIHADPPSPSALQTATTTPFTSTGSTPLSPIVIPSTLSQDCESSTISTRSVDSTSTTTSPSISNVVVPTAAIVAPTAAIVAPTAATSPATTTATVAPTAAVIAPNVAIIAPAAPVVATVDDDLTPAVVNSSNPVENAPCRSRRQYKKCHPHVTTGQYRVLWGNIDEATRKAKKAERKAGKALVTAAQAGDARIRNLLPSTSGPVPHILVPLAVY
ncbi:uncharacterized protein LACBIDRAFT_330739 [Laccaria bicolor S238N-H82]|uniref:Predicted protein n=1 Tax=Laccaria bicolor (strain S238N-H82 / ATCC MYA-4686) TaxID=486041 RepID=B0DMA5_LACBS|nr:uncharacterized protein LACBIDRAFT_330739 [Laccaria bicolor S238N-H82]EDR04161.1 predicted protein [Laccaria bicolor S238N-H82]|eukprot:XP_001885052.1 predicted protein [Laccaria bicolor S238N-H82]